MKKNVAMSVVVTSAMLAAASMVFCAGCEKDSGPSEPAAVAGTWEGTRIMSGGTVQSEHLKLSQNGNAVSGVLDGTPVSGTIDGNSLSLYGSTVRGDGVVLPKKMSATANGRSIIGTETWGIGDAGSGTAWLAPMSVSLYRAGK